MADMHVPTAPQVEHGPYNCAYCRMLAYAFVAENPKPEPEADWYVIVPGAPWGGKTAAFGPMPEDRAREMYARFAVPFLPECPPKLLRVIEDYAQAAVADGPLCAGCGDPAGPGATEIEPGDENGGVLCRPCARAMPPEGGEA